MSDVLQVLKNSGLRIPAGRLASAGAVVALRLLSIAAGLFYIKVYTHFLAPGAVGTFFYLSTLSYVLNALIFVPVDFYTQARVASLAELPLAALWRLAQQVLLTSLVVCVTLSLPLVFLGKLALIDIPALYLAAALIYLCTSARGILNNRSGPVFVASMLLFEGLARLATFAVAVALFGGTARALMYSTVIALALEFGLIVAYARHRLTFSATPGRLDTPGAVLRSAAPVAGSAVFNVIQLQVYRVLYPLANLGAISGVYAVVSNLGAAAMAAVGSIFSQIHLPNIYNSRGAYAGRYIRLAAGLSLVVLILGLTFSETMVRLLTKDEYLPYALAIGFGIVTEAGNLIIGAVTVYLMIDGAPRKLLIANAISAIASLGGCVFVIYWRPTDPFSIGFPIACSQLLMTVILIALAFKSSSTVSRH